MAVAPRVLLNSLADRLPYGARSAR